MNYKFQKEVIEAYEYLYDNNKLSLVYNLLNEMQDTFPFDKKPKHDKTIYPNIDYDLQIIIKQYLYSELITKDFNDQLLLAIVFSKKITHPLPKKWRDLLIQNSLNIDIFVSKKNFLSFVMKKFLNNFFKILSVYKHKIFYNNCDYFPSNYIQLCDISAQSLPKSDYNIFNWLITNYNNNNHFDKIFHNLNVSDIFYNQIQIASSKYYIKKNKKFSLFIWIIKGLVNAIIELTKGNYYHLILYYEAFLNVIFNKIQPSFLANEYLFSISNFIYRPMWTYTAKKRGSQITLYGYASSFGGFKTKNSCEILEHEYNHTTWPKILFWTKDYVNFIKSRVNDNIIVENVEVPISFTDNGVSLPRFPEKTITIFDVSPVDDYHICRGLINMNYRNFRTSKLFLLDIYEVCQNYGYKIIWKRKRQFTHIHSKEYINFCNEFEKNDNVITIDPDISAFRVILNSEIIISMPFTSTSFIAKYYGKKTFFYDPTSLLFKDDRGAQGITLVTGKSELYNYFKSL